MSKFLPFALLALSLLFSFQVLAQPIIVATVSGVPVTEAEVRRELDRLMPFRVQFHSKMSPEKQQALRQEAVDALIERAYKVCAAIKMEVTVSTEQIDEKLASIKSRFKTEDEFLRAVQGEGLEEVRASIYRELLADKAESVAVDNKVSVTDRDVESFYNENKQNYRMPMQFRASHILLKVDPASNAEERAVVLAKAENLLKRARAGEDFYNLAYFNSDDPSKFVGGDLGLFHEGQTAKPFEDELKRMQIGEISGPVKTRWGYHVVKLMERNPPRQMSFEEMAGKIRELLIKKQKDQYFQQWMSQLKADCRLEKLNE